MSWWWNEDDDLQPPEGWVEQGDPDDPEWDPYYQASFGTFRHDFSKPPLPLASTLHPQIRNVLGTHGLKNKKLGEAVVQAIEIQMGLHAEQDVRYREIVDERDEDVALAIAQPGSGHGKEDDIVRSVTESQNSSGSQQPPTLFAQAASRIAIELGKASEKEAQAIAKRVPHVASLEFKNIIWKLPRLPYAIFSQALQNASAIAGAAKAKSDDNPDQEENDIDEWIIRNEKYMRARLILDQPREEDSKASATNDDPIPSLAQLGIDKVSSHWKEYMVGLGRDAKRVFVNNKNTPAESPNTTIRIERPDKAQLPGLLLLDQYRKDAIEINALPAFQSRFDSMTFGALKGLNWSNVLVAGGIALAALTCVTDEEMKNSESSDIDLYVWGLTADQANTKLQEIEKVFVSNLPADKDTGKPIQYAVLRNSQTITFMPGKYPYRRVQVVLKLCPNPMAILLNFDLDQVAIGYTGDEVWMLPRASRALITGYTTFTMDLIHGSFLAPRKATQDQRVFKYAERGYGLRFLPSYLEALGTVPLNQRTTTENNVPEESLLRDELSVTMRGERARVAWWLAHRFGAFTSPLDKREVSMNDMTIGLGNDTPELAEKSSMSGWQLFARHVALWELAQLGYCRLKEQVVSHSSGGPDYVDDGLSYDDTADYSWNHDFTIGKLQQVVDGLNQSDEETLCNTLETEIPYRIYDKYGELMTVEEVKAKMRNDHSMRLRRQILASSLEVALQRSLVCTVHVPKKLRTHAEAKLSSASSRFVDVVQLRPEPEPPVKAQLKPTFPRFDAYGNKIDPDDEDYYEEDEEDEEDYLVESNCSDVSEDWGEDNDEVDTGFVLLYWVQGLDPSAPAALEDTDSSSRLHWQLVSREADEIHEILHAFRRAHRNLTVPLEVRNERLRLQIARRLVRPTERSERDAFVRWANERAPKIKIKTKYEAPQFGMLTMSRNTVFRRFEMTIDELADVGDLRLDMRYGLPGPATYDHLDRVRTAEEWMSQVQRIVRKDRDQCWNVWYRQRLPPAHFLPTLSDPRQDTRQGKRKREEKSS
ncbi:hypothetical protein A4X13_0g6596 [Tilletia indica]|uniref:Uncharacterized protein n=1 Tax=Tilletia indica TaxID=43049 RepID=A0A177THN2_9BASI|nr:hypothetical protein A4X13_0g6596 [Tilletia indica]